MKKVYIVRHGQTLFNLLRRKQGWCDSPLTDLGIQQAKEAGEWLKKQGISFEFGYTSTSERAVDTFELIAPDVPYERRKGLKEWNFGKFEGVSEDLNPKLPYRDFFVQFGGEDEFAMRERIFNAVKDAVEDAPTDPVLIVTHGGAIAQFMRAAAGTEDIAHHVGNCCIVEYDYADGKFDLKQIYDPHSPSN